ncbi:MAG: PQQ-like beta-propeller repeat protein [Planctomycetes bacterium]|nr:PQQ-like beta-propeller repeat protein [Planctomycetota bacterium]
MARVLFGFATLLFLPLIARADDWPQWLGPKRDGVWRENGLLDKFPKEGPKVLWRADVGEGYAGPAVAGGRVFIADRVLAKDAANPKSAFSRTRVEGKERVLCLDEAKGTILWKQEYDCPYQISYASGPRTTPVVSGDRVYTYGAMGDLLCLDVKTGNIYWHKKLMKEYNVEAPTWGFAGHPLIDGNRLFCLVGGKGSVAVAFDKDTGRELWKALSAAEPGYAPPTMIEQAGKKQLILWHPESVNSLNPETGEVYWTIPWVGKAKSKSARLGAGMSIPTPRLFGDRLFLTCFYDGSLMLKLNGVGTPSILWKAGGKSENADDTVALHAVMVTPVFKGDYIYGVCSYGEMRGLKADSGERLWDTHQYTTGKSQRWGNAFIVEQGDRFILFNEQGDLILAKFHPKGHEEISRAHILDPTNTMAPPPGRRVIWSHPAFANRHVYARNDREIICVSMAADQR